MTDDDIQAVVDVLRSPRLTTGPQVAAFEEALASAVGAREAVSFSSGTAALHAAAWAAGLGPGDEAIVSPLTFCATANCVLYQGATPVFADVRPDTLALDPDQVARAVTQRTKALLPVDYAGHPADLDALMELAARHGLVVIEDACHALGASFRGRRIGSLSHLTVFSFHPVKHVTTGEGGAVTTNEPLLAKRLRMFRYHGIDRDADERQVVGRWEYEMTALGYNYRLPDVACALGRSQLRRLDANLARRREIAGRYARAFRDLPGLQLPSVQPDASPAWHLYPIRIEAGVFGADRATVFRALRAEGLGVNVHYMPVYQHAYYRGRFGDRRGLCPVAETAYTQLISLPMFHAMTDQDVRDVIEAVGKVAGHYSRNSQVRERAHVRVR